MRLVCALSFAVLAIAGTASPAAAQLRATLVVSGLRQPLGLVQDPTDHSVLMMLEQAGRVRVVQSGVLEPAEFIDLLTSENSEYQAKLEGTIQRSS